MKKILSKKAPVLILWCFSVALAIILLYELCLVDIPSSSHLIYVLGIITSKTLYSIIAASTFYFFSQYIPVYIPKRAKTTKILFEIYIKTSMVNDIILNLKTNLTMDENNDNLMDALKNINPTDSIDVFPNWYMYLNYFKTDLLNLIGSMTVHGEYISKDFLHELMIIERQLLSGVAFCGYRVLACDDLTYAVLQIQEILVHNEHLQKLNATEFKKEEQSFKNDATHYRKEHYNGSK